MAALGDNLRHKRVGGKYFRRWMRRLNLSYEQVAETLGVHPITVRNWEKADTVKPLVKFAFDHAFRCRKDEHEVVAPKFTVNVPPPPEGMWSISTVRQ